MNGWTSSEATRMITLHTISSFDGQAYYCIEPGVPRLLGKTYTRHGEDYWKNYPSDCNSTIDADTIKTLPGRIMQYSYQGDLSTSWRSQNDADADKLAHLLTTQVLVWETVVREGDANFNHVDPGSADAVKSVYRTSHPLYGRFSAYYDRIKASMQKHIIVPSFMARSTGKAQTVERNWDGSCYSAALTDTNGVLGNYRFSANKTSVSFSVHGNVLTISAQNAPTGTLRVTAEKEALRKGVVVWSDGHHVGYCLLQRYKKLPENTKQHVFDTNTNALLSAASSISTYDDEELLDNLVSIFASIAIEDWNDATADVLP